MSPRPHDHRRPADNVEEISFRRVLKEHRRIRSARAAVTPRVGDVINIRLLFVELNDSKIRPAVVVEVGENRLLVAPLSSRRVSLKSSVRLVDWEQAGLSRPSRILPIRSEPNAGVLASIGRVSPRDWRRLHNSLLGAQPASIPPHKHVEI